MIWTTFQYFPPSCIRGGRHPRAPISAFYRDGFHTLTGHPVFLLFHHRPVDGRILLSFYFEIQAGCRQDILLSLAQRSPFLKIDKGVVSNAFDRSSISLYDDIYSTPGQKKYYVVKNVLEKFTSKVGQFVEVMDIEDLRKI